jgi:heptosyltransferase-2
MRLGVFVPNWVGDVVMATPAIRGLRKLAGEGELIGIMRPYVAEVLSGTSWFDRTVCYAKGNRDPKLAWPQVRHQLASPRLDMAVLLTNSLRTAWMAWQSGALQRIGTAGNLRGGLLTTKVYPPRQGFKRLRLPAIDGYLQVAQAAGAAIDGPHLELATTPAEEQLADYTWKRLGLSAGKPLAVLNTGGAFGAAKDWPAIHFTQLARRLATEGVQVLVNCGPKERETARQVASDAGHPGVTSLADEPDLPIGLTKAAIRRAQLLISTDSGPRFFGVAFGVPTISLFGPTSTYWTRTYGSATGEQLEIPLSLGLDCQPCMARTCPLGHHGCLADLSVDRVHAAARAALQNAAKRRAA